MNALGRTARAVLETLHYPGKPVEGKEEKEMGAVARNSTITVCLAAILMISPHFAAIATSEDSIEPICDYQEEEIELLAAVDNGEETKTWETAWIFGGSMEPDPTGPYDEPIPEDPIP